MDTSESDIAGAVQKDFHHNGVNQLPKVDNLSTNDPEDQDSNEFSNDVEDETESLTSTFDPVIELNEELQAGYKILTDLMAYAMKHVNWPFMESVETTDPTLFETYKLKIAKPMWLKLMKEKFETHQYSSITDFVSDFRLMLENCYHFNGPDHLISKRAVKLEMMLEQKLALLSREIREKTSIAATSGERHTDHGGLRRRPKSLVPHNSSLLMTQLREEQIQRKKDRRRKMILDRRAEREALAQEIHEWEETVLFRGKKEHMKAMWEIPQIGLFLVLLQEPLNIGEVMHFELERSFVMPRESTTLARIMTSLLSTPFQRVKFDKKSVMPYKVWESKLRYKLQVWFKMYADAGYVKEKVCLKLGIDEQFFDVMGAKNPLEKRKYHELSLYRKVWILKSLCDYCLHMQESLRDLIELQPFEDQRELVLGTDASGQRYIHFPQFCGADVRVYRQAAIKYPKIEIKPDPFDSKRKFPFVYKPPPVKKKKLSPIKKKSSPVPSPVKISPLDSPQRTRPSRLRQAPKVFVPMQLVEDMLLTEGNSDSSSSSSSSDQEDDIPSGSSIYDDPIPGPSGVGKKHDLLHNKDNNGIENTDDRSEGDESSVSEATIPYCDNSDSDSNGSSREASPCQTGHDLKARLSSCLNQSSDVSRESSPCISPADFIPRRSARLDRSNDTSRDASPLIFDADFGLRRGSRMRAGLKNIPPYNAARDLTSFLFDENSTSNSSIVGDNSLSEQGSSLWVENAGTSRQSSCETGEDSNFCDINNLFSNSRTLDGLPSCLSVDSRDVELESNKHDNDKTSGKSGALSLDSDDNQLTRNLVKDKSKTTGNFDVDSINSTTNTLNEDNQWSNSIIGNHENSGLESVISSSDMAKNTKTKSLNNHDVFEDSSVVCCNVTASMLTSKLNFSNVISAIDGKDLHLSDNLFEGDKETENKPLNEIELMKPLTVISELELKATSYLSNGFLEGKDDQNSKTDFKDKLVEDLKCEEKNSTEITNVKVNGENVKHKQIQFLGSEADDNKVCAKEEFSSEEKYGKNLVVKSESHYDVYNIKPEAGNLEKDESVKCEDLSNNVKMADTGNDLKTVTDNSKDIVKAEVSTIVKEDTDLGMKSEESSVKALHDPEPANKKETEEIDEESEEDEMVPDPKEFYMVADSVEELRILARQFEDPEPLVLRRGKREVIQPLPPRKKNVIELHERLLCLLKELEPWEGKLHQATRNARIRLRREVEEYEEPPEEKMNAWDTSDDEATDSGNSDVGEPEGSEVKQKSDVSSVVDSQTNSGASTPIKALEDEEIDVSQRGRLRKRRIIPNNVEDQYAIKKSRQTKWTDVTSATTQTDQQQAVIVQSGKTQLVDYADIVRQLSSSNIMKPVLFKTVKGGKTVITSVIPISSNQFAVSGEDTATFRMTSCSMSTGRRPLIQPLESVHVVAEKPSQHPTIRTLLSANPNVTAARSQPNDPEASVMEIQSEGTSQQSETTQVTEASGTTHLHVSCETTTLSESSPTMAAVVSPSSSQTTPHKIDVTSSVTLQKMAIPRLQPSALQITPRKIAPVSVSSSAKSITKIQTKYYAANASTLPINVVQQLINERGAKLSTGAYNQSILLIPMDNNGQTTNLLNIKTEIESSVSIASPANQQTSSITPNESKTQLSPVLQSALRATSPVVTPTKSISNQLILPKPPGMLPPPLNKHVIPSSTRYPSNETVRTLLDKRKSTDEKKPPYKVMKLFLNTTQPITFATAASDLALGSTSVSTQAQMDSSTSLVSSSMSGVSIEHTNPTPPSHKTISINPRLIKIVSPDSELQKAQQCVITSISPAKLNTLLLQTSAAGAKSIPSMIKLPSKAALDSAVKAVVTSVNTSLPTVNIKVPSPTSLPSIVPRRNVTKTIQTMKSPIPVAPKVITQYSGGSASLAVSNSSMSMAQPFHMLPTTSNPASAASTPESNLIDVGKANKMAPHVVISKGQMQLRFFNTDSGGSSTIPLVSSSNNPSMRTLSVLSPSTGQSMKSVSSDTATEADPVDLKKSTKPVIALNANGMPIAALRVATGKSTNSTVQVSPSSLVHNTLATGGQVLHTTSSSHLLNHCQPTNLINSTTPSGTQAGLLSPLINLHHGGLVLPAGVQLASPLGLNLLQSGTALHNQGNQNILQGGANPIVTPQLYGINPLMLNTVISAPTLILGGQAKTQMSAGPVESTQTQTNLQVTMAPPLAQLPGSSIMLSSVDASGQLLGKIAATPSPAQRQLVFQCPPGGQQLSALGSHHVSSLASTTNTVTSSSEGTSLMKLLKSPLVTYVDYRNSSRNKTLCTQATESLDLIKKSQPESKSPRMVIPPPAVVKGPKQTISAIRVGSAQVQMPDSQKASTSQQQKLLLFSIGGQLVTGQGVPVTLSNGVLKVLPNGKVIINNQTLTQEQVKQTLSKINNNVATLATNMIANPNDQQSVTNVHVEGKNINVIKESPVVSGCSTTMMKLEDPNQLKKTVVTKVLFDSMNKPVKVFTEPSIGESQSTLPFNPNSTIVQKEHDIKHVVAVHSGLGQPLAINIQSSSSALKQVTNKMGISHGASNQSAETSSTKRVVARPVNGEGDAANADEADEEEHRLVIDDGRSEKEAALNLLTLANQALIPGSIKVELNEDYYDEKSAD